MGRTLVRMVRDTLLGPGEPPGPEIRCWDPSRDHERIRFLYGMAFGHEPWPTDWEQFDEFDPEGVLVAEEGGDLIGFVICFMRSGEGYISVVAIAPGARRRGIASALVRRAVRRLRDRGAGVVRIDAYEDARAAVEAYRSLGFEVYDVVDDPDADPRGSAEE
jgi:ribosomal protein S18 acetylase RimI-like enzyme